MWLLSSAARIGYQQSSSQEKEEKAKQGHEKEAQAPTQAGGRCRSRRADEGEKEEYAKRLKHSAHPKKGSPSRNRAKPNEAKKQMKPGKRD
jgi:hypothetical protein